MITQQHQTILQGRYKLNGLLGKGGFGEVYAAVMAATGEEVAVKIVPHRKRNALAHEADVMRFIQCAADSAGVSGVPTLKYFGHDGDNTVLVMTIHGPSLEKLRAEVGKLPIKTVAKLGVGMIGRIQFFHSTGFIHRDIKPGNFLMGVGKHVREVYLIDFGLSVRYSHAGSWRRTRPTSGKFVGTSWFASLRTHQGYPQSRRDDMEQLVYSLIYMHRGRLPWSEFRHVDRAEKTKAIAASKEGLTAEQICFACPPQFQDLLMYAKKLKFDETPRYDLCREILWSALQVPATGARRSLSAGSFIAEEKCGASHCTLPALRAPEDRSKRGPHDSDGVPRHTTTNARRRRARRLTTVDMRSQLVGSEC